MTPAGNGRHCARCQTTVIDFTQQSDAEILAYLARAAGGRLCGRFAAGQLERPLQRAAPAAPWRWWVWLAALAAVWGLREGAGSEAKAQAPTEQRAAPGGSHLEYSAHPGVGPQLAEQVLMGMVLDSATRQGLPGVTVVLQGTTIGTGSDRDGNFILTLPIDAGHSTIDFKYSGYYTQSIPVAELRQAESKMQVPLVADLSYVPIITGGLCYRRPWPWHPRAFHYWAKYWLTRPFRH